MKKEIPWQARRRMAQLEHSTERLRLWIYRITITMLLIIVLALVACVLHFYI